MNVRKIAVCIILCLLFQTGEILGQQEPQYTQFLFNKLSFNPAYAGARFGPCVSVLYRKQWLGLEGAPETQVLNFHTPISANRIGLGVNISRLEIGISESLTFNGMYAYRFTLGGGNMALGLLTSFKNYTVDYTDDRLVSTQPLSSDNSIQYARESKILPNFGMGIYYNTSNFFVGFSIPRMLQNDIDFADDASIISRELRHFFLMSGVRMRASDRIELQPSVLLKYVKNAPFDAELNLAAIYQKKYTLGITYRAGGNTDTAVGESLDLVMALQLNDHFLMGLSYDFTLSDIKNYDNGSVEILLEYCFSKSIENEVINPRFF